MSLTRFFHISDFMLYQAKYYYSRQYTGKLMMHTPEPIMGVLVFSLIKHEIVKYKEKKNLVKTKKKSGRKRENQGKSLDKYHDS